MTASASHEPRRGADLLPRVESGARIGIAALSSTVDPLALARGLEQLRRAGYEPVTAPNLLKRCACFAGTDRDRVAGFHELLADSSVRAIVFARGGHGVLRILGLIDWAKLVAQPRVFVGYSDLTPLLLEIHKRTGWPVFHGPMVAAEWSEGLDDSELASFVGALDGSWRGSRHRVKVLHRGGNEGTVDGVFTGGCLSLLAATTGTDFGNRFPGNLLFLEDVGEPLYRADRMLTQLRLSGSLIGVKALISGYFSECPDAGSDTWSWFDVLCEAAESVGAVAVGGLAAGHSRPNLTLPLGVGARLDLQTGVLEFP